MTPLYCFDTMVFIWCFRRKVDADAVELEMNRRSDVLLRQIRSERARIIVPAPCVAEALMKVPPPLRPSFMADVSRFVHIAPFDVEAALYYGKLEQQHGSKVHPSVEGLPHARSGMRIDYQVVAIACAQSAMCIYSHDRGHLTKYAQGNMTVRELPETRPLPRGLPLFEGEPIIPDTGTPAPPLLILPASVN